MDKKTKREWHDEIEYIILNLEDCEIACEGMTAIISYLLTTAEINHTVKQGYAKDTRNGDVVVPHMWVELDDGWIVDLRLRYWLGDNDRIPHGVFHPDIETVVEFYGEDMPSYEAQELIQDEDFLMEISEGKIKSLRLPEYY